MATPMPVSPEQHDDESRRERVNRELIELLNELRVALPGVQVLFAFLLTVPFTQRFHELSNFDEKLYYGVLICVALASVLLVAPTAGHRVLFRQQQKEFIVTTANNLALAGLFLLAIAMTGAIALISDFLFGTATAIVSAVVMGAAFVGFWYAGPVFRRANLPPR